MATTMKDLMGSRRWALLAATVTLVSALVLGLGATKAFAVELCIYDPGAGSSCGTITVDGSPKPHVISISPQDGATGVSRNTNVRVTFSEPMNPYSVKTNFLLYPEGGSSTPATVSMVPDTNQQTFVFDPYGSGSGRLEASKVYNFKVSPNAQSADGQTVGYYWYMESWTRFTTPAGTAPYVTQVSPPNGATGVSRSTNIKVTFSEAMDPTTVNGSTLQLHTYDNLLGGVFFNTEQVPATVSKDPTDATGRTYLLDPYGTTTSSLLSANRKYRVTLTTGARDLEDEYPISSNKVWYFNTGTY